MLTQPTIVLLSKLVLLAKVNTEMSRDSFVFCLFWNTNNMLMPYPKKYYGNYVKILFTCACQIGYKLIK